MVYAETFGIPPQDVGKVSAAWWFRWLVWQQANASRNLQQKVHTGPDESRLRLDQLSEAQLELLNWADQDE